MDGLTHARHEAYTYSYFSVVNLAGSLGSGGKAASGGYRSWWIRGKVL